MVKNIYKEIQLSLPYRKLFNEIIVEICIRPSEIGAVREYQVYDLVVNTNNSDNEDLNNQVTVFINNVKSKMEKDRFQERNWKLFYLLKEILQGFVTTGNERGFNYFRGQAKDWELTPGIFRPDTSEKFIENFENIYKNISYEYPTEIKYVEYSREELDSRSKQLSVLQHYGLRTSLIDVTKNPYIALLFMVSDNSKADFNGGTLDLYRIDEDLHATNNIFMPVAKSNNNKRLTAQKGAFFNYDMLFDLKQTEIEPIDRIILKVMYSPERIREYLNKQNDSIINQALKNLDTELKKGSPEYNGIKEAIIAMRDQNIVLLENVDELGEEIFSSLREEIKVKLEEYFYFERNLFPDLDKYIDYLQTSYIGSPSRKRINS